MLVDVTGVDIKWFRSSRIIVEQEMVLDRPVRYNQDTAG